MAVTGASWIMEDGGGPAGEALGVAVRGVGMVVAGTGTAGVAPTVAPFRGS